MSRAEIIAQSVHIIGSVVDDLERAASTPEGVEALLTEHDEIDRVRERMRHLLARIGMQRAA